MTDDRTITAEHEAAHAVAYLVHGYPIYRIEIEPGSYTQSTAEPEYRDTWDLAVISLAGVVVEDRYRHQSLADRLAEAAEAMDDYGDDHDVLGDMRIFVTNPDAGAMAGAAYKVAAYILELNADLHAEITAALLTHDHLTADDLAELPLASEMLARAERTR